jgi:hypothetical protein
MAVKNKTASRWLTLLLLGASDALLISLLPRVLTHHSSAELHRFLFMNRSLTYWLFILFYVSCCVLGVSVSVLVLMRRSTTWLTAPITTFVARRRAFTWSEVIVVGLSTLALLGIPEIAARALFVYRYGAPATLLVPFLERFDQNMAVYGHTRRSAGMAQNDVVAFRQSLFEYRPYVGFSPVPGFRPTPRTPKSAFRVVFLGGSAMEHSAAPVVRDLQAQFNQTGCEVEIINAGRSAYVSGQELVMTLMEVLQLQPDLLIVFDGYNDLSRVEEGEAPGTPEYTRAMAATFKAGMSPYQALLDDVAQRSFLLQVVKSRSSGYGPASSDEASQFRTAVEIYGSNIEKMSRLATVYGYGLAVAIQPLVFFRDQLGPTEAMLLGDRQRAQRYRDYYQQLIQRAQTVVKTDRVYVRDLTRVFSGISADVFYDTVHFDGSNAAVMHALGAEFADMMKSYPRFPCRHTRATSLSAPRQ